MIFRSQGWEEASAPSRTFSPLPATEKRNPDTKLSVPVKLQVYLLTVCMQHRWNVLGTPYNGRLQRTHYGRALQCFCAVPLASVAPGPIAGQRACEAYGALAGQPPPAVPLAVLAVLPAPTERAERSRAACGRQGAPAHTGRQPPRASKGRA